MKIDPSRQLALLDEYLAREAKLRLRTFVELAWPILEPGQLFMPNWHIELICDMLEAVTARHINRLVINAPPRHGKSLIVSTMWPVWEWLTYPTHRWLFVSHSDSLATFHAVNRRRLLLSEWYQRHWGRTIRLARDQATKGEMHNSRRGMMTAMSMGTSPLGKGGNRIVIDDPHSPEQVESDAQRLQAVLRFQEMLATRLDDKARDAVVLVTQRLHERDLAAVCIELGYESLVLEALATTRRTYVFPRSGRTFVREEGTALWPERESVEQLADILRTIGSYAFSAQYQQRPVPRVGAFFPRECWAFYDVLPPGGYYVQSWDLSFKDGATNDYVVGLVAYVVGACVYIVDRFKAKASFTETQKAMIRMAKLYPQTRYVLVEETANGPAILDALHAHIPGLKGVQPQGGKSARAAAAQPRVEAGQVFLPKPRQLDGTPHPDRDFVQDFIDTLAAFPKGAHDDDVDALSQLLAHVINTGPEPAGFMRPPQPFFKPRIGILGQAPRRRWPQPRKRWWEEDAE